MSASEHPLSHAKGGGQSVSKEYACFRHVLACVKGACCARAVLTHAATIASAVGAKVTVLHVLESSTPQEPMDPVEWSLRHCDQTEFLQQCLSHFNNLHADIVIVAGPPAERITDWAQEHEADLVVIGRGSDHSSVSVGLGYTARRITEIANASVLVVPSQAPAHTVPGYQKILIPLDGSARSECVLPLGLGLAAAASAQVMLMHVAPKIDLIEPNQLNAEVIALREQLHQHNERAARQYLDWLRSRLPAPPITHTRLLPSSDPRLALEHAASEEQADLLVISALGNSGHAQLVMGSVADYLINRITIPILLVRQCLAKSHRLRGQETELRRPNQGQI